MTHKGEKYSVKLKKYYFCNGTMEGTYLQLPITLMDLRYRAKVV